MDAPRVLPLEPGTVRPVLILGAERLPAGLGLWVGMMMIVTAIYGQWKALYGLPLVVLWHGIWVLAAARDPQYCDVLWRQMVTYPWPDYVSAWPGVLAKRVKIEPSVPVRGEGGVLWCSQYTRVCLDHYTDGGEMGANIQKLHTKSRVVPWLCEVRIFSGRNTHS